MYPQFSYRSCPDVIEFSVMAELGISLVVSLAWCWDYSLAAPLVLFKVMGLVPLAVFAVDVVCDVNDHLSSNNEAQATGLLRLAASVESTFIRTWSCCGRLWGHVVRGRAHRNVCKRFDWFCGMTEGVVAGEKRKASQRFALFLAACVGVVALAVSH